MLSKSAYSGDRDKKCHSEPAKGRLRISIEVVRRFSITARLAPLRTSLKALLRGGALAPLFGNLVTGYLTNAL